MGGQKPNIIAKQNQMQISSRNVKLHKYARNGTANKIRNCAWARAHTKIKWLVSSLATNKSPKFTYWSFCLSTPRGAVLCCAITWLYFGLEFRNIARNTFVLSDKKRERKREIWIRTEPKANQQKISDMHFKWKFMCLAILNTLSHNITEHLNDLQPLVHISHV